MRQNTQIVERTSPIKYVVPAVLILVLMACTFAIFTMRSEVEVIVRILLYLIPVVMAALAYMFIWSIRERVLILQTERKEKQNKADVTSIVAPWDSQVFIRELNLDASWRDATADPRIVANGKYVPPTEDDYRATILALQARSRPGNAKAIEPLSLLPETALDLLTVFSQPLQAYATIGGQQTGKTYQNQHIASAWIRQGVIPYVVAPKWDVGEWPGCKLLGGNTDWGQVENGIALIRERAEERHSSGQAHKSHPIQPVFFDDWTPTVNQVKSATALILEATTLYASVNILLYFIIHSDTADAWGVGRKGAALKNNFVKLFILPQRDLNGSIVFGNTQGEIAFPGEENRHPVRLLNSPIAQSSMVIEANAEMPLPTDQENRILEMWDSETMSYRQMTKEIWGDHGGPRNEEIKAVLRKFSRL